MGTGRKGQKHRQRPSACGLFCMLRNCESRSRGPYSNQIERLNMAKQAITVKDETAEGLPSLFANLANDLTELFDAKLALLKIELREDIEAYVRSIAMIIVGAVVALVGFSVLNVAIAFFVSTLFQATGLSEPARYGLGFFITALVYLAIGGVLIVTNKNKLGERDIVPTRTINELKKDKERIQEEIQV